MPRPVSEQVVVITGASSGIGREAALLFGEKGASVVLAARNQRGLQGAAAEIERLGGKAYPVATDVAEWEQVERLAQEAVRRYGRIDTWVNNAAVSVYATAEAMTPGEIARVINVNLLGEIYGTKAALPHMRRQSQGTIINISSVLGERAAPLQSAYSAAKHGIVGFTEAVRMELEHEKAGIDVVLVLPASVNTPIFDHARSKMGVRPVPIPPVYEPRVVAEAILHAAAHPQKEIVIGVGKLMATADKISPSLVDRYMLQNGRAFRQQLGDEPDDGRDNLFKPMDEPGSSTGRFGQRSSSTSLYTRWVEEHPVRQRVLVGLGLLGAFALMRRIGR